jgi:flagellar biosynthetic protein FlhB
MAEESAQERTEKPSAKRLREAKERGQVPRSRELNTTLILIAGSLFLYLYAPFLGANLLELMGQGLTTGASDLDHPSVLGKQLGASLWRAFNLLLPLFGVLGFVAIAAPSLLGGWLLSGKKLAPKWSNVNPLKGLQRIFSPNGLMEVAKAIVKLLVVGGVGIAFLRHRMDEIIAPAAASISSDLFRALRLYGSFFAVLAASTMLIAVVDVPFQIWSHMRKLRMTRQELKEEMKETEGRPEVKSRIRNFQRQMAQQRMMEAVPHADVVVTNPTHFAVVLKYEPERADAPRVVARGADLVAWRIRTVAEANAVPVFEEPLLARALYNSCKIGQEIPALLYLSVAQVLAYIYQLRNAREIGNEPPRPPTDIPVPEELVN